MTDNEFDHAAAPTQGALPPINAGILIGGASRRMGRPKHLIEIDGQTLVERIVAAVRPHVSQVCLIGAGDTPSSLAALPRLADPPDFRGPLAGMTAAFAWSPTTAWLFVACDLPWINSSAVAWLLGQRSSNAIAIIPMGHAAGVTSGATRRRSMGEPLFAVYEPSAMTTLSVAAKAGNGPSALISGADVSTPLPPFELLPAWRDADTPADLPP